jgi:hypothetical protein
MTSPLAGGAGDPELQGAIGEWLGEVARALEGGGSSGDPEAVVRAAVACWAVVHGLTSLRAAGSLAMIDDWLHPAPGELAERASRP